MSRTYSDEPDRDASSLREANCQVLPSSLRICVSPGRMYTYPDPTLLCGEPKLVDDHEDILLNPTVLFEVLSPETETYDS